MHWWWIVAMALVVLWFGWEAFRAYLEARSAPHVDMFTCDKHGLFPAKYAMTMPLDGGEPYKVCPMCYEEAFTKADAKVRAREGGR